MNQGVINIHILWRPMSLLESGLQKTWEIGVASQCAANGVKCAWMIIWSLSGSQQYGNWMG